MAKSTLRRGFDGRVEPRRETDLGSGHVAFDEPSQAATFRTGGPGPVFRVPHWPYRSARFQSQETNTLNAREHAEHLAVAERAAREAGAILLQRQGNVRVSAKGPRDLVTEADVAAQACIRSILLDAFPSHRFVGEESEPSDASGFGGSLGGNREAMDSVADRPRWIVDPLDGTTNYVHGFPAYCVSIALAVHNRLLVGVVHDPVAGETFSATSGGGAWLKGKRLGVSRISRLEDALAAVSFPAQATIDSDAVQDFLVALPHVQAFRRSGSTALNLAWLASGRLDAFWVRRIQSWDVAAGLLLVREAGGFVTPLGDHVQTTAIQDVDLDSPAFVAAASPELVRAILELLRPEGRVTSAATAR